MSGGAIRALRRLSKRIWVRATMFSLGAVATALLAGYVGPYIPYDPELTLAAGSVDGILNILAASMLAVTTFSLSIMVSAYASASANTTPRATRLLREDSVAQNTLATFVGTFLFSIAGIIGIVAGAYSGKGRIILFAATLIVLLIITVTLLRWIEQLGNFGRVSDTIHRIEAASLSAARLWGGKPRLGAGPPVPIPAAARAVAAAEVGHIENIDFEQLAAIAVRADLVIHILVQPGDFVHPARPLAYVSPGADDRLAGRIADCFATAPERAFDQDLRFGLVVLSEVASRALSPAVNDPGTAIEVIDAGVRVLLAFANASHRPCSEAYPRLHAPDLRTADLFEDFFNPIARDGSGMIEVQHRLQTALEALALNHPDLFAAPARAQAETAAGRAREGLDVSHDQARLHVATAWIR